MWKSLWKGPLIIIFVSFIHSSLKAQVLPDVKVANEWGVESRLASHLGDEAILVMGFYHCKHMCNYIIRDLAKKLESFKKYPRVVYFGIDEREGPRDALQLKKRIIGPQKGLWSFLVADKRAIDTLARALGFEMSRDPVSEVITHEMGIYAIQDGFIHRKMDILEFSEKDLDFSQRPSSSHWDAVKKFCSEFNPQKSKHGPLVMKVLSSTSVVFLLFMGIGLFRMRRRT